MKRFSKIFVILLMFALAFTLMAVTAFASEGEGETTHEEVTEYDGVLIDKQNGTETGFVGYLGFEEAVKSC